jgi:hypothetical protein
MLLTVVAQVATTGEKLPYLSQPVVGTITLRGVEPLKLTPLSPRANPPAESGPEKLTPILPVRQGKDQVFKLSHGVATHWYLLAP